MQNAVNNKAVTAHVFEYTATFGIDPNLRFVYPDKGIVPTQIIFCIKERNQKKINSHRWFFNAFARLLQVSLEVPTRISWVMTVILLSPTSACSSMWAQDHQQRVYTIFGRRST
jgi:hypothetical protein